MMTLEEAIEHCEQKACNNSECSKEHKQLAEWLKELQALRRNSNTETIRERAEEYNKRYFSRNDDTFQTLAKVAYIAGATEQRKIDIMRVRQFLEREAAYNGSMTCIDYLLIEELCKVIEE